MLADKPNIVQAELFHTEFKGTLKATFEECLDRNMEGSRSKTVVRFYDEDGIVTDFMERWTEAEKRYEKLLAAPRSITPWGQMYSNFCFRRAANNMRDLRDSQVSMVTSCLQKLMQHSHDIAIERMDFSFRRARPEELHELLEAVGSTRTAWLLLMKPNDLLSGTQSVFADTV